MIYTTDHVSPLGKILLAADEVGLIGLWFYGQKYFAENVAKCAAEKSLPIFDLTKKWLDEYFAGEIPDFTPPICFGEFSDFRNKSIFYFGGFMANNSGWGIDEENAVHSYSTDDGLESPTIECSEYMMDKEMLKELTGLVRLLGISDTPQNVLFINGSTYLIPEENLEKVEALLQSRTRAVG